MKLTGRLLNSTSATTIGSINNIYSSSNKLAAAAQLSGPVVTLILLIYYINLVP